MNCAIQGRSPIVEQHQPLPPKEPLKELPKINIALIGAAGFHQNACQHKSEVFLTSLHEIDQIIKEKMNPASSDNDEEDLIDSNLPAQYRPWRDVFSKKASDKLSPHQLYDHKIELTGENALGYSPLYKQSAEELEATKKYLMENLDKGFIVPSRAPFASPILFVRKANGGLHLCVDYQKLNNITKKN
ncbi:hypothetical protein VTN00DRAFT_3384 [Thermoascus crustaceus]|uniref:uncharacterized protein n=1 Tax=Thermoascus crustaceus TaxID=5088 RepID=UPI003743627E